MPPPSRDELASRMGGTVETIARAPASEVGWSTEWGGISSRGRLVVNKPRRNPEKDTGSDSED